MARSYRQYCGLARALDILGERWTLLLVRELLDGPRGYNQLAGGMPGIATNLLADRLRSLVVAGVIHHRDDGRYELTDWGQDLQEVVYALGRWAGPLMARPRGDDHFRMDWLRHMVVARFEGHDPDREDLIVELSSDGEAFTLVSEDGRVDLTPGRATPRHAIPDVILDGPPEAIVGVLLGRLTPEDADPRGVTAHGDLERLPGLRPRGERAHSGDALGR